MPQLEVALAQCSPACAEGLHLVLDGEEVQSRSESTPQCRLAWLSWRLTFEVRRGRRRGSPPAGGMIRTTRRRAGCLAVGPRLDRGVRPHWLRCRMHLQLPQGYTTCTPETLASSLNRFTCLEPATTSSSLADQLNRIGTEASRTRTLPGSSGSEAPLVSIETWLLVPVVAPQSLVNATAVQAPDGEVMRWTSLFAHRESQPAT